MLDQLRTYILADESLAALAAAGNDVAIAAALNAESGTRVISRLVNERTLLDAFTPAGGEAVMQTLEAVAASQDPIAPLLKRALRWMTPSEQGIDIGSPAVRGMLNAMASANPPVLSQSQVNTLKALAQVPSSIAYAQFGQPVTIRQVSESLLPTRTHGQIGSQP